MSPENMTTTHPTELFGTCTAAEVHVKISVVVKHSEGLAHKSSAYSNRLIALHERPMLSEDGCVSNSNPCMWRRTCDQHDVTTTSTIAASSSGTLPDPRDADMDEPRTAGSALDFFGAYAIINHRPMCQYLELFDRRSLALFLETSLCWCLVNSCTWWCGHLS